MTGARELNGADEGNENVQDESCGLDGEWSQAEEGHGGDVTGSSSMTDGGIEECNDENAKSEEGNKKGGVGRIQRARDSHKGTPMQ